MRQILTPFRRRAALLVAPVLALSMGTLALASPSEAATRRVSTTGSDFAISISPDAIRVDAGGVASFPVRVRSASRTIPKPVFDVDGLPDYIDAEIERVSTSTYRLNLYVPSNAPTSNAVYKLIGSANRRSRNAYFRLEVVGRTQVTRPPAPTVPTPTIPATTQPPVTQPPVTAPPSFGVYVNASEKTASTGETVGYPVAVDRSTGYGGPVQFTLVNLPSTIQAGFLPNPSNGDTVLYLTPKAGTAAGRYVLTVVGTAGSTQRAAAIALTVKVTGEFALLATPQTITRTSNGSAVYRIDIATPTSDRPTVAFTAEGVPTGTSLSFSANNTTAKSINVTANVGASTPNGTYNITLTGRSGAVTKQVVLQLIVNRPTVGGFSLSATPSSLNIQRGNTAAIALTVSPFGGFTGTINTTVSGLPAGTRLVSISNTTATVNQPFVLTITLAADAGAPVSSPTPITITSSSGIVSAAVQVGLGVI